VIKNMRYRLLSLWLMSLCFASPAAACYPVQTGAETLFSLLAGANTFVVVPLFIVVSVILCIRRERKRWAWTLWILSIAVLVSGVAWALSV
jgi:hypothetical protein